MLLRFELETEWLAYKERDITTTEVPALFGLGRKSLRRLWHEKRGDIEREFVGGEAPKWGKRLQIPVGMGICEDQGWTGRDLTGYFYHDPVNGLGASLDIEVECRERGRGLLEIKLTDYLTEERGWMENAAPIMFEFQIHAQLHAAYKHGDAYDFGCIGAFGGITQAPRLFFREYDPALGALIDERAFNFWKSINDNNPPDPNYEIDGELLELLRGPLRQGDICDLSRNPRAVDLAEQFALLKAEAKPLSEVLESIKKKQETIKSEIHDIMGRNEFARVGEYHIGARKQASNGGGQWRRFDFSKQKGK